MKLVVAVIRPSRFDEVRSALGGIGVHGLTVSEVKGHGRQSGHVEIYRGAEYEVVFVSKLKLEIVVPDEDVASVMASLGDAARTDAIGDGKVFVLDVPAAMRVRTGETGDDAL